MIISLKCKLYIKHSFGVVFKRNEQFSKIRPVPSLGNAETPIKKVEEFYDFW